jgi:hypothetical protein
VDTVPRSVRARIRVILSRTRTNPWGHCRNGQDRQHLRRTSDRARQHASAAFLTLGYGDNNYSDNGYRDRDSGIGDQCSPQGIEVPNAWVQIGILHNYSPLPLGSGDFHCGPHLFTYVVQSLSGVSGAGIRCVQFETARSDKGRSRFVWYGEGTWGSFRYRHLGTAVNGMFD